MEVNCTQIHFGHGHKYLKDLLVIYHGNTCSHALLAMIAKSAVQPSTPT